MTQPLERSTPEQQGIPSQAILDFVNAVEAQVRDVHSFMLLRRGVVVAEGGWQPYLAHSPHILYSLSKSFTSTAVGLAIAEDRLALDDPIISFFPEDLPAEVSPNLAAMRVRHLLSMSTGHAADTANKMMNDFERGWERVFLEEPVDFAPGTHFVYNSGATYMLASILHKLTGQTLVDYLMPRLFEPLGIERPFWEVNPRGVTVGFKGLRLKTGDIARFGQLYLNRGEWQGRRLLPENWVDVATAKHVENGGDGSPVDWSQGYGFQFWRCQHGAYRGDGAFGQYCVVMPEQQAVLAITSGTPEMQVVLDQVWQYLLPAMTEVESLPYDPAGQDLAMRLAGLEIPPPRGQLTSHDLASCVDALDGQSYRLEPNYMQAKTLRFHVADGTLTLETITPGGDAYRLDCGVERWQYGVSGPLVPLAEELRLTSGLDARDPLVSQLKTAASACWTAPDRLEITARYYETPFVQTLAFAFTGDRLTLDARVNVSFGPLEGPQIIGQREV